jgi:hypothetical protein
MASAASLDVLILHQLKALSNLLEEHGELLKVSTEAEEKSMKNVKEVDNGSKSNTQDVAALNTRMKSLLAKFQPGDTFFTFLK